ncbi:hypothetical protein ETB97_011158 [Aspergillus alliaceus]|uniref:Uncharacterized protein n=1 Tax=Petromyces alliaceus TaxID=209559 RepID=A0A8H6A948_PETAA|nr:hypothetical protein ETB97_011158 [Aspergillus burnettii]
MRPLSIIIPILSAVTYTQATTPPASQPISTDILYWPITSAEPSIFARISYDPSSLEVNVASYSPPTTVQNDSRSPVRIGLYTSNGIDPKQWTGTLTSWTVIAKSDGPKPILQLYLDSSNKIYHAALTSSTSSSLLESATASTSTSPNVKLVHVEAGPRPHLNRPVAVGPDGIKPEEIVEKTFFQK